MSSESDVPPVEWRTSHGRALRLQHWFVLALSVGGVAIFFGERLTDGSAWVTIGGPIACMTVYIVVGRSYYVRQFVSRTQFADSIYYLGFLFTLTSITAAIMDVGPDADVSHIVNRFGVKLITTLIGLGVRVYIVNFRPSADDVVDSVEESLTLAAQRMTERLDQVTLTFDGLSSSVVLTLTNARERISSELSQTITEAGLHFSETLTKTRGETSASLDALRAAANRVAQEATEASAKHMAELDAAVGRTVEEAREGIASALGELRSATLEASRKLRQSLTTSLRTLEVALEKSANEIGASSEALVGRLQSLQLPDSIFSDAIKPAIVRLANDLQGSDVGLAGFDGALRKAVEDCDAVSGQMSGLASRVTDAHAAVSRFADALGSVSDLSGLSVASTRAVEGFGRLADTAEDSARRLGEANRQGEELKQSAADIIAQLREQKRQLDADQAAVVQLMSDLRGSLAGLDRPVVEAPRRRFFGGPDR